MEAEVGVTDSGAEAAVTDSAGVVLAVMDSVGEVLAVMVLAHLARVLAGVGLLRDSAGRTELRVDVFLVEESAVASVIAVSVGESAAFAIVGFAIWEWTLSLLESTAVDVRVVT